MVLVLSTVTCAVQMHDMRQGELVEGLQPLCGLKEALLSRMNERTSVEKTARRRNQEYYWYNRRNEVVGWIRWQRIGGKGIAMAKISRSRRKIFGES